MYSVGKGLGRWSVDHGVLGEATDALLLCEHKGTEVVDCNDHEELEEHAAYVNELESALYMCIEAFHVTREYVGKDVLYSGPGWAWYDAVKNAEGVLDR